MTFYQFYVIQLHLNLWSLHSCLTFSLILCQIYPRERRSMWWLDWMLEVSCWLLSSQWGWGLLSYQSENKGNYLEIAFRRFMRRNTVRWVWERDEKVWRKIVILGIETMRDDFECCSTSFLSAEDNYEVVYHVSRRKLDEERLLEKEKASREYTWIVKLWIEYPLSSILVALEERSILSIFNKGQDFDSVKSSSNRSSPNSSLLSRFFLLRISSRSKKTRFHLEQTF